MNFTDLRHFGIDFTRSILVTEYLERRVDLGDGTVEVIHNARQLLDTLEDDLPWYDRLHILLQASRGLTYLHTKDIVHCDIKAGNIMLGTGSQGGYVAKIGDFGQACYYFTQFSLSQATSVNAPGTSKENDRVSLGTAPYTAPELMEMGSKRTCQSDIFSLGMVMAEFSVTERSHPWEGEIDSCELIFHHVKMGKRPTIDISNRDSNMNYDNWLSLMSGCWKQEKNERLCMTTVEETLRELLTSFGGDFDEATDDPSATSSPCGLRINNICLDIHQSSVTENAGALAAQVDQSEGDLKDFGMDIYDAVSQHDGTSACQFFSIMNLDKIYDVPSRVTMPDELKRDVESTLRELPAKINNVWDKQLYYNAEEVLGILNGKNLLKYEYELRELIMDQLNPNRNERKADLVQAITQLTKSDPSMSIYTCSPVSFVLGFVMERFIVIDTHCIPSYLDGNGNALVKLVHCVEGEDSVKAGADIISKWITKRIEKANSTGAHSLLLFNIVNENVTIPPDTICLSDEENSLLAEVSGNFDDVPNLARSSQDSPLLETLNAENNLCKWNIPSQDDKLDDNIELLWRGHLTTFGMSSLKPFQLEAIRALERGKDVIVVQKTGSGKSLCYQLPSLFEKSKTSVVICPTISLINSQVESLTQRNITAVAAGPQRNLNSDIFYEDELPSLIYTTPEYFDGKLRFQLDSDKLKVIVIDEVHKLFDRHSQFRSSYDSLRNLHAEFPNTPIMALTATLTEEQLQLLCSNHLNIPTLIRDSVNRQNIKFHVGKYRSKRPVKGDKSMVWMDTAKDLKKAHR